MRGGSVREVNIKEHPAEIAISLIGWQIAVRQGGALGDQCEIGGELPRAEARPMKTLPGRSAAVKHTDVLRGRVVRFRLIRKLEMRLDHIGNIDEERGSPLLTIVFDNEPEARGRSSAHCP